MVARRFIIASILICFRIAAEPPLTTIQDVLYKADGSRFNGTLAISWDSFEASDTSNISRQSLTVKVVDGNLRVQLVPTTTAVPSRSYTVKYNSDGRVQFEETWAVPPSLRALRVRDVRTLAPLAADSPTSGPVMESDVVGLLADLGARPLRGTVFTSRRAAVINGTGLLESAAGNPDDCLRVDGSSGPCGDPGTIPGFVDHETPSGLVDGSNRAFSVASVPDPSPSLAVYRNGVLLKSGLDYIVADNWITFTPEATPQAGDVLLASYRVGSSAAALTEGPATPRVLCAGVGTSSAVTAYSTIANCAIAPGALQPGDRVELRFDCSHEGTATGFALEVMWGDTTVFQRNAAANDALVSGRADAALHSTGAQMSTQSWGTALGFAASVASAQDSYSNGLNLQFFGKMNAQTGETVTLRNYTVLRYRQ